MCSRDPVAKWSAVLFFFLGLDRAVTVTRICTPQYHESFTMWPARPALEARGPSSVGHFRFYEKKMFARY
jgi:hypothetical protein